MNTNKRIVFTVTNDLSYDQRMHRICSTLAQDGFIVTLVGRFKKNSKTLSHQIYSQHRIKCIFSRGFLFYLEYNIRLFFYLLIRSNDIYGAVDADTILPHAIVSFLKRKIMTYDAHEYFTEVPEVTNRLLVKSIWKFVEWISVFQTDLCYTVAPKLAEVLEEKLSNRFHVIQNVPSHPSSLISDELIASRFKSKIIIYQGALNVGRGLEIMIQAMQEIDAQFWMIGDGDITDDLKALTQSLNLDDRVKFLGLKSPEELYTFTMQATIGYNVLEENGLSYYYSLSNKFFDYIQAGVPSLSSDFIEYQNILEQYSVGYCVPLKIKNIQEKINILLNDATIYQKFVSECLKARSTYHWDVESKKLLNLYHAL